VLAGGQWRDLTFVLDQGSGRTYPANTRYLTTPEGYDESPDQTLFRDQ
jgi:hypothetical protein